MVSAEGIEGIPFEGGGDGGGGGGSLPRVEGAEDGGGSPPRAISGGGGGGSPPRAEGAERDQRRGWRDRSYIHLYTLHRTS